MTRRRVPAILAIALAFVAAACSAAEPSGPLDTGALSSALPTEETPGGESTAPEDTGAVSSSIPGFEGWRTVDAVAVDIGQTQAGFGMTLLKRAEWSGTSRGVLFFTTMDGDFRLTATIRTRRTSDSSQGPGGDGTTQLAGLMVRSEGTGDSWVVLEIGGGPTGLVVATDSTTRGAGRLVASAWNDNEADLKVCRTGTTFTFWKRAADSDDDWTSVGRVERADLHGSVEVGADLSANATPDLTALFDNLTLERMDPGEAC